MSEPSERNPYRPPQADLQPPRDVGTPSASAPPASRWLRLAGAIIDSLSALLVLVVPMTMAGYMERAAVQAVPYTEALMWGLLSLLLWLGLHGYLISTRGQTIGKRIVGTQIVAVADDKILPLSKLFSLRVLPVGLAQLIPFVGILVGPLDALLIFGQARRCGHDYLAGTKVIMFQQSSCQPDDSMVRAL